MNSKYYAYRRTGPTEIRTNSVAIQEYTGKTKCNGHSTFKDSILSDIARKNRNSDGQSHIQNSI